MVLSRRGLCVHLSRTRAAELGGGRFLGVFEQFLMQSANMIGWAPQQSVKALREGLL